MTVCGKSNENTKMNVSSRNLVSNRPSFMITDILSKASDEKAPSAAQSAQYLQHLERFSAMNHGFGMMIPPMMPMQEPPHNQPFGDSDDDDDFHGSDDADGQSTDGSNHGKEDDDLNQSNRSNSLPSDRLVSKKQRKARTAFTDHQLHSMEKCFSRQKYLSVQDRMELANKLGISDTQVKTWFQNRRTKWKRQTAVGLEYFVEGNYAAYQRAYAARYGQMDSLPSYAANPLMMPGAGPLMPPSNMPSVESYYQQILQNSMNSLPPSHANIFAAPHRPLPMMPGTGFLPLSPPNSLYPASRLPNISTPPQHHSPEHPRPNSLSPAATSPPSHSPKMTQPWSAKAQSTPTATTNTASDNESDIEV